MEGCLVCSGGVWTTQPHFVGPTLRVCDTSNAGLIRYNAGAIEYCNGAAWRALGGPETDPKVGPLTAGRWCTSDGTRVNCASTPPVGPGFETDPKVGTLTANRWCRSDGTRINCTENTPEGGGYNCLPMFGPSTTLSDFYGVNDLWGDTSYLYVISAVGLHAFTFDGTGLTERGRYAMTNARTLTGDDTYLYVADNQGRIFALTKFVGGGFTLAATMTPATPGSTYAFARLHKMGANLLGLDGNRRVTAYRFSGTAFSTVAITEGADDFTVDDPYVYALRGTSLSALRLDATAFATITTVVLPGFGQKIATSYVPSGRGLAIVRADPLLPDAGFVPSVVETRTFSGTEFSAPTRAGIIFDQPTKLRRQDSNSYLGRPYQRYLYAWDQSGIHVLYESGQFQFKSFGPLNVGGAWAFGETHYAVGGGTLQILRDGCLRFY